MQFRKETLQHLQFRFKLVSNIALARQWIWTLDSVWYLTWKTSIYSYYGFVFFPPNGMNRACAVYVTFSLSLFARFFASRFCLSIFCLHPFRWALLKSRIYIAITGLWQNSSKKSFKNFKLKRIIFIALKVIIHASTAWKRFTLRWVKSSFESECKAFFKIFLWDTFVHKFEIAFIVFTHKMSVCKICSDHAVSILALYAWSIW